MESDERCGEPCGERSGSDDEESSEESSDEPCGEPCGEPSKEITSGMQQQPAMGVECFQSASTGSFQTFTCPPPSVPWKARHTGQAVARWVAKWRIRQDSHTARPCQHTHMFQAITMGTSSAHSEHEVVARITFTVASTRKPTIARPKSNLWASACAEPSSVVFYYTLVCIFEVPRSPTSHPLIDPSAHVVAESQPWMPNAL